MTAKPLFDIPFLASQWDAEYRYYLDAGADKTLLKNLEDWVAGGHLKETSSEGPFVTKFFNEIWGYTLEGNSSDGSFQSYPQFSIEGAGLNGGTGQADLALGNFIKPSKGSHAPQILCEFKDVSSDLDKKQNRKGNDRSPVEQCFDYLWGARKKMSGLELVEPYWAIVSDMNEFRLYSFKFGKPQYQCFVIEPRAGQDQESLLGKTESASFLRFLFGKLFHESSLLSKHGPSYLQKLLNDQLIHEQTLEKGFYLEYKAYREFLYKTIRDCNPQFSGTAGQLVRLTQRFLDRCLFVLFCEDMGASLDFPVDLLRDMLLNHSGDEYFDPDDNVPWDRLKNIFAAMRDGGEYHSKKINRFNGGLFESLPDLENLSIPARVFCAKGQGAGGDVTILAHPLTLLFFSAKYNFGIKNAGHERVIDFFTLGRIFEQSITELEIMEAEAEGRPSINLLSKRKRNGVYYTPEWVTDFIVRETVGARLAEIKKEVGLIDENEPTLEDIARYQRSQVDKRISAPVAEAWISSIIEYFSRLDQLRIIDPACGSGAFLIQALEYLMGEYRNLYDQLEQVRGFVELWETDAVTKAILTNNIYGVDINPESVEIAKLALWMHTAVPGKALSSLDHNIRCGNSLVGSDFTEFFENKYSSLFSELDEGKRERINSFDWKEAFPEVFSKGGFDCVIGNPPYVKLQHFRRVESDVAEYLVKAKQKDGSPLYASSQVGNFDLYLPFIEKGIEVLMPDGFLGYIAPNVWMVNEYGKPLRQWLKTHCHLDRWIDFKSYQVFSEATTYTALQFFKALETESIQCAFASDGDVSVLEYTEIPYSELDDNEAWNLLPDEDRGLIAKLNRNCHRLDDKQCTQQIFQGLITSADAIYHLKRITDGVYCTKSGEKVIIEDALMHPLVSGPEAKRYQLPKTDTYLIFPYDISGSNPYLYSASDMADLFPNGWDYLRRNEPLLRARENGKMNSDSKWWGYNYPKNLDKHERSKLCVAQTVPGMRVCFDHEGVFYFNNVRVNGILIDNNTIGWFLLGVLNCPVVDFVFRRIAKPKDGGYFEANKQFIAPLPIPEASDSNKCEVGEKARALQDLHTQRRDLLEKFSRRLRSDQMVLDKRKPRDLWGDVRNIAEWKKSPDAPKGLVGRDLTSWAKNQVNLALQNHFAELDARLHSGAVLTCENNDDEIMLLIDGVVAVEWYGQADTPLIAAQWRNLIRITNITEKFTAKRLLSLLLALRGSHDLNFKQSIISIEEHTQAIDLQIGLAESGLNGIIYGLYGLSQEEIILVEKG